MALALTVSTVTGLLAGALIVAVGAFVLAARPRAWLHRLFFLLALFDGGSTLFFGLSYAHADPYWQMYFQNLHWYYLIAFIAVLWVFALVFPTSAWGRRATLTTAGLVGVFGAGLLALYAWRHDLFWLPTRQAGGFFTPTPLGNLTTALFLAAPGLMVLRLTRAFTHLASPSHRRQSAYVLGGLALAFAPQASTYVVYAAGVGLEDALINNRADRALVYWASLVTTFAVLASAVHLARHRIPDHRAERRFVLRAYAGVAWLSLAAYALATLDAMVLLRTLALLAYPLLLAYAILRYEVFDIDRRLRRAATVALTVAGAALLFVIAQEALEGVVATRLAALVSSDVAAGLAAAVVVAGTSVPLARAARKASRRLIPELTHDELAERKLEVYRHSLEGALEDGILAERESRTLARLRESLGLSDAEHAALLREVTAGRSTGMTTGPGPHRG